MKDELEYLIGRNIIHALAEIIFEEAKKVEIPLKLKDGTKYKITVEGAIDE
nr:MAG TPA: hypothetical protein [Caudoviricetes sp.]